MKIFFLFCSFFCFSLTLSAQNDKIYNDDPMQKLPLGTEESAYYLRNAEAGPVSKVRVEPPNWWVGMQEKNVQVLLHDAGIGEGTATVNHGGVQVTGTQRVANSNYLFVNLVVDPTARPGQVPIQVEVGGSIRTYPFELKEKPAAGSYAKGLSQEDLVYLIMPDRFANGDTNNDSVEGMAQQGTNRAKFLFRHGGDLIGIMERLDYLQDLGVTAIWLNPVLENDQPYESYHGYAVTDHYRIDRRFGTNDQYRQLVRAAHERGIKVVMDVIFNHVGDRHWFIEDLPAEDWIHQWPEYTQTTYRATTLLDPHASERDYKLMTEGWFDKHMPDLNQQNELLANYLIQNSIWWVLNSEQDGYRIDTYAYPDPAFMTEWNRRLLEEFPGLGIFGETWVHGPGVQAWFAGNERLHPATNTHLPGVTDFQLYYAINDALANEPGWTDGVLKIYYTLAQDYLYDDPTNNVLFLDNHDLARYFTSVGEDTDKFKSGLALLLTLRGIPMLTYGTELLFSGAGGGFGEGGRVDFPGGWRGDKTNLFKPKDRSPEQTAAFDYVRRLARFRRESPALREGKLTQFVPRNGLYVYFRETADDRVMVVFNGTGKAATLDMAFYADHLRGAVKATDVTRGTQVSDLTNIELGAKETRVFHLDTK